MSIRIEIVCLTPDKQLILSTKVPLGTTVKQALEMSHFLAHFPEIDLAEHKIGIYGKVVSLSYIVDEGDRVEIYRPLEMDPKVSRKLRAQGCPLYPPLNPTPSNSNSHVH